MGDSTNSLVFFGSEARASLFFGCHVTRQVYSSDFQSVTANTVSRLCPDCVWLYSKLVI